MGQELECAVLAKLAFGRTHDTRLPELAEAPKRGGVGAIDDMANGDPALRLLEREVAEAREHEGQLLLVVRPPPRLLGALHDDDAELSRVRAREGAHGVRELIVRNEEPLSARFVYAVRPERLTKDAHREGPL